MDGWMDEWMDVKADSRTGCSNQKLSKLKIRENISFCLLLLFFKGHFRDTVSQGSGSKEARTLGERHGLVVFITACHSGGLQIKSCHRQEILERNFLCILIHLSYLGFLPWKRWKPDWPGWGPCVSNWLRCVEELLCCCW